MKPTEILLVEDNEGDIVLIKEALAEGGFQHRLTIVRDGEDAVQFLNREGMFANESLPDLIIMDINLPRMNGMELLRFIKQHLQFRSIPVVMLTTSSSGRDILDAYRQHVNSYIIKPGNLQAYISVVHSIMDFWINIVRLPIKV
jgi:CheY-like chemotaxis protein